MVTGMQGYICRGSKTNAVFPYPSTGDDINRDGRDKYYRLRLLVTFIINHHSVNRLLQRL